mmetsp:Transcript_1574/g.2921  ORF Transcript_1574/g.2921 Transcript_1574/m.2921 type:complete len:130 (-) Transcript_1574:83-472(-)
MILFKNIILIAVVGVISRHVSSAAAEEDAKTGVRGARGLESPGNSGYCATFAALKQGGQAGCETGEAFDALCYGCVEGCHVNVGLDSQCDAVIAQFLGENRPGDFAEPGCEGLLELFCTAAFQSGACTC